MGFFRNVVRGLYGSFATEKLLRAICKERGMSFSSEFPSCHDMN